MESSGGRSPGSEGSDEPVAITAGFDRRVVPLLRLIEDGFNTGNVAVIGEFVAADYVDRTTPLQPPGPAGVKGRIESVRASFPDSHITVEDIISEGEKLVWVFRFDGTHEGEFLGIPPTGRRVSVRGVGIERIREGRIVEHWGFVDRLALVEQLRAEGRS